MDQVYTGKLITYGKKWRSIFLNKKLEAFAIKPLCIIFRYSDRKGVKNAWALTHVATHTRSSEEIEEVPADLAVFYSLSGDRFHTN